MTVKQKEAAQLGEGGEKRRRRPMNLTPELIEKKRQWMRDRATTHGHKSGGKASPEYTAWQHMRMRCTPGRWDEKYYYGKGIRVCHEWQSSFEAFIADMGPKPSPEHSLDRIDSNGDYTPSNCKWSTRIEQARNRKNNHFYIVNGERKTLAEWCLFSGASKGTIRDRLKHGWCELCALTTPPNGSRCIHKGEAK